MLNICCILHKTDLHSAYKLNCISFKIKAYKELLLSLVALQKIAEEDAQALYKMLENNVCYVMEFRETMLYTVMNYSESHSTK